MEDNSKSGVIRLERVASVRQTLASVAEARVREAEAEVRDIELEDDRIVRTIQDTQAEITHRSSLSGHEFQQNERYIQALEHRRKIILQSLEKAKTNLAQRRQEWIESRREQRIIERLQDRRLQEWERLEEIAQQKSADDAFIGRLVRSRT